MVVGTGVGGAGVTVGRCGGRVGTTGVGVGVWVAGTGVGDGAGVEVGTSTVSVSVAKRPMVRVCAYTCHTPDGVCAGIVVASSNRPCGSARSTAKTIDPVSAVGTVETRPMVTSSPASQSEPTTFTTSPANARFGTTVMNGSDAAGVAVGAAGAGTSGNWQAAASPATIPAVTTTPTTFLNPCRLEAFISLLPLVHPYLARCTRSG